MEYIILFCHMKKLAVLLPTFNSAFYLKESIDSILNQTFADFDLYIYDDCSTDSTPEIISEYKDSRLFYRKNKENSGIARTLNKGLEELLPNYEYIARMDADDWSFPERFQKQIDFLDKNKEIVMCGTQGYWLKDFSSNPKYGWEYPTCNEYLKLYLLFGASFGHSSLIFRTNFFIKNNLKYNQLIKTCEDWDLWIKVSLKGMIENLPDFLMKYRILPNSNHRSPENKKTHLKERCIIISNYWKTFNIILSPEQVFEFYYDSGLSMQDDFSTKLKIVTQSFNELFLNHTENLEIEDKKKFSYLLARKILDYWKRSNVNRYHPVIWLLILSRVKFMGKVRLIKSQFN